MKYRILTILSLLLFAVAQADPPFRAPYVSNSPSPIFITDGVALITSEMNNSRLDKLIRLSKDIYPIQIGAFRLKTNAERMFAKITRVLGEDVVLIEEDGFFKVRVTKLNKEKIKSYLDGENNPRKANSGSQSQSLPADSVIADSGTAEKMVVEDTSAVGDTISGSSTVLSQTSESALVVPKAVEQKPRFFLLNSESPWLKRINYFGKSIGFVNSLIISIVVSICTMIILLMIIL